MQNNYVLTENNVTSVLKSNDIIKLLTKFVSNVDQDVGFNPSGNKDIYAFLNGDGTAKVKSIYHNESDSDFIITLLNNYHGVNKHQANSDEVTKKWIEDRGPYAIYKMMEFLMKKDPNIKATIEFELQTLKAIEESKQQSKLDSEKQQSKLDVDNMSTEAQYESPIYPF